MLKAVLKFQKMNAAIESTLKNESYDDEVQQFLTQVCSTGHNYVILETLATYFS